MKKVLFVIESLQAGGAEKSLVTLLSNLDLTKHKVELLLFTKHGSFEKFVPKNIHIIYLSNIKESSILKYLFLKIKFWISRKYNKQNLHRAQIFWHSFKKHVPTLNNSYDIAIAYNQGFATYFVSKKISAKHKYAWVNTDYELAGYKSSFDMQFYNDFDRIIAVSDLVKQSLTKSFSSQKNSSKIEIIKDISDVVKINIKAEEEHNCAKFDTNLTRIVSVGRLEKPKAFQFVIKASNILRNNKYDFRWFIIGEGSERKYLEQLINKYGLADYVVLLGYKENPYPFIKNCDIYVQTSLFEGLGLTLIEAAILNKPIISTNFPTASTIISNNKTGIICEMNEQAIAKATMKYIDNPSLRRKMEENLKLVKHIDKEKSLSSINKLLNE